MPRISAAAKTVVRRNLLETAALHFAKSGLAAASVDAISFDAGYAKGTLYNYFRSKEEIFEAVVEEGVRRASSCHGRARSEGTTRDRLVALAEADLVMVRENEAFAQILVRETMSFHPLTYPMVMRHRRPYLDLVGEILEDGVNAGQIRFDRPIDEQVLLFVGNLALLYVQHWGSGGKKPALDDIPRTAVDSFLEGAMGRTADHDALSPRIDQIEDQRKDQTSQLSLFPLFFDDDSLAVETARRSAHDRDGEPTRQQALH